ncbi:hypothetical protein FGO68_gene6335 [Halteria grandinella]|uniref:Uncharacterized protein n=1 Tax=Halteria grandinella TaxID=5974 RepID=A0A8J8P6S1_HALGN|nr:hypothetical protein FGO68_gene6335 [Halteria grandinella]
MYYSRSARIQKTPRSLLMCLKLKMRTKWFSRMRMQIQNNNKIFSRKNRSARNKSRKSELNLGRIIRRERIGQSREGNQLKKIRMAKGKGQLIINNQTKYLTRVPHETCLIR